MQLSVGKPPTAGEQSERTAEGGSILDGGDGQTGIHWAAIYSLSLFTSTHSTHIDKSHVFVWIELCELFLHPHHRHQSSCLPIKVRPDSGFTSTFSSFPLPPPHPPTPPEVCSQSHLISQRAAIYSKWMSRPVGSSKYLADCLATDTFLFWSGAETRAAPSVSVRPKASNSQCPYSTNNPLCRHSAKLTQHNYIPLLHA